MSATFDIRISINADLDEFEEMVGIRLCSVVMKNFNILLDF